MGLLNRGTGPPVHNIRPCSRPGEDPNAWKQFGPVPEQVQAESGVPRPLEHPILK